MTKYGGGSAGVFDAQPDLTLATGATLAGLESPLFDALRSAPGNAKDD
jgi:hypothetical protein